MPGRGDSLKLQRFEPRSLGAQPILSVAPTLRGDGSLSVLAFNKGLSKPTALTIRVPGARAATAEALVAPALESTNETDAATVHIAPVAAAVAGDEVRVTLPAFSLTGVMVSRR